MKRSNGAGRHIHPGGITGPWGGCGARPAPTPGPATASGRGLGHWVRRRLAGLDRRTLRRHLALCPTCAGARAEWRRPARLFAPSVAAVAAYFGLIAVVQNRTPMRLANRDVAAPSPMHTLPPVGGAAGGSWAPVFVAVGSLAAVATVLCIAYALRLRRLELEEDA